MKRALTIAMAGAALAATVSLVIAGSSKREPVTDVDTLPGYQIVAAVRAMGLDPISEPARRGSYYVLHAYDPYGIEVRVVADAQFGDILSVAPARAINTAYAPHYERGPRIIHIPQTSDDRASINKRDEPAVTNDDEPEKAAPPPKPHRAKPRVEVTPKPPKPRSEIAPKPQRRSDAPPPPPPGPPRTILSAPPPPAEGPSPIRPIPRADSAEKFQPPRDSVVNASETPAERKD